MTGEIYDHPSRLLVKSRSDSNVSYLVDLCKYPVGVAPGVVICNGTCQCSDFIYRCEPKLKKPEYMGRIFRCAHLNWARENCLDFILNYMREHDQNVSEDHQP